jgi:uncharacterized protein (TIGR00369 family)
VEELTRELAEKVLAAQPFSVLLGARIASYGDDEAALELDVRDELRQQNGYVHGGVLAYLADNALTFAGGLAFGPQVLTGGFTISYLRPASGPVLRARANVVHAGGRQATCRCELYDVAADGTVTLCAAAQGTVVSVRRS